MLQDSARDEDMRALLAEVDRFARRSLEPAVLRHEVPLARPRILALLDEAQGLGLGGLDGSEAEGGVGVWEGVGEPGAVARSVAMLRRLARTSASFALALHQLALGAFVTRGLGVPGGPALALVQGRYGLGRLSFARLVMGAALDENDHRMLADVWALDAPRLLTAVVPDDVAYALPWWSGGELVWTVLPRAAMREDEQRAAHGFDDVPTWRLSPRGAAEPAPGTNAVSSLVAASAFAAMGALAIATGAAEAAHERARAFAAQRRQGGALIEGHAAVQKLLARSASAIHTASALLEVAAREPVGPRLLRAAFTARLEAHPILGDGINDALQVFGGLGYMRDTGIEKLLRASTHLRVTFGSPPELALFVAEAERVERHGL